MKSKQNEDKQYVIPAEVEVDSFLKKLSKSFTVSELHREKRDESYYDTFEWNLFARGFLLKRRDDLYSLRSRENDLVTEEKAESLPHFFHWNLQEGKLRNALRPISDIRALSEIINIKKTRRSFNLLNKDRKTVVRLKIDSGYISGNGNEKQLPLILQICKLRGYEKPFGKVALYLGVADLQELDSEQAFLQFVLSLVKREVLDYSSKLDIKLAKESTLQHTVSSICMLLNRAMEKNYQGVVDDIDSEFLHDFRIAIRRTRSLIGQIKNKLPQTEIAFFQNEFKWLGSTTGPVRDIDVYLLKRSEYRSLLPKQLHAGLDEFFVDLEKSRVKALAEMRSDLSSSRYNNLMKRWQEFLSGDDGVSWNMGGKKCYPIAVKLIRKRFNKVLKDGREIDHSTPDESLHRLRIQGKKLRYLLEFFRSYFNENEIDFFLKQLKKLQNNLGDFNDVSVQLEMLSSYQARLMGRNKRSVNIAAAVGGLVSHLANQHKHIRQKFEGSFSSFASEENVRKFNKILA